MHFVKTLVIVVVLTAALPAAVAKPKDPLHQCWVAQVKPLAGSYLELAYIETVNELEHSFEPWQQTIYTGKGKAWVHSHEFGRQDTLRMGSRAYYSKTQFKPGELLLLNYGEADLSPITKSMIDDQLIHTARYSPIALIQYLDQHGAKKDKNDADDNTVYLATIGSTIVRLHIRKADNLAAKITTLHNDELLGDVETTYTYNDYTFAHGVPFAKRIEIAKVNGRIIDEVYVSHGATIAGAPALLLKPAGYTVKNDETPKAELRLDTFADGLHFLELKHTDDRVLIVEFKTFVVVAEAPLNSENGERIIDEVKKIAPGKPVKYFVFGHYHPHYIGGIRPFVHKGAQIICSDMDELYVRHLVAAKHSLRPDSLQLQPKPVVIKPLKDSLTVSDGDMEMRIYFIGSKSEHTNDYLIYYFPKQKLLFEDDLVWIDRAGEIKKAGRRQAGLYHAIKSLGLDVTTIVQSWPVADYGVKTVIPFSDLEKSMSAK